MSLNKPGDLQLEEEEEQGIEDPKNDKELQELVEHLPFNVKNIQVFTHDEVWATVLYKLEVQVMQGEDKGKTREVFLKRSKTPDDEGGPNTSKFEFLASRGSAVKSKQFYDQMLTISPELNKFIPPTLFFRGRFKDANPEEKTVQTKEGHMAGVANFRQQTHVDGRELSSVSDEELYEDPEVVKQLLEFIEATIKICEENKRAMKKGSNSIIDKKDAGINVPDLYGYNFQVNVMHNPRFTENLLLSDKPVGENKQKVFFIDTDRNTLVADSKFRSWVYKHVLLKVHLLQLKRWRKKLTKKLGKLTQNVQ